MDLKSAEAVLIHAGQRLDRRQLIAGTEGNLSIRLEDETILITGSGAFKGELTERDLLRISLEGKVVEKRSRSMSSESEAHLTCYRLRPDVHAVVHAHPVNALALMLRGEGLDAVPLVEAAYAFGSVPTAPFAVPGTPGGGRAVATWVIKRDAILLDRHGAITVGVHMDEALARMEILDAVARTVLLAGGRGRLRPIEGDRVMRIADAAVQAGARREAVEAWAVAVKKWS
ncbi:MAG: class II aldolase/adducin family protein [bacterium]